MSYKDLIKSARKDEELKSNLDINNIVRETNLEIDLDKMIQNKINVLKTLNISSNFLTKYCKFEKNKNYEKNKKFTTLWNPCFYV